MAAEIEDVALGLLAGARHQERFDHVVNVIEIALLPPFTEEIDHPSVHRLPDEPGNYTLPIVTHQVAWAIGVSQAQAGGAHSVNAMVKQVVMFGGQLVNAVNVDGSATVLLVKRQVQRFAVYLPRAGVDDLHMRIEVAAGFEQGEL